MPDSGCFLGAADQCHAIGAMLTGLLVNHFVLYCKPVFLFDGNQPNVGKTLLVWVIAAVLDGCDPTA